LWGLGILLFIQSRSNIIRCSRETYLPTKQTLPQSRTWFSHTNEIIQWTQHHQPPPPSSTQGFDKSVSSCYPKAARVRTRRQYQRIAHQPTRHIGHWVVVESRESKHPLTRLGVTVSRHYGNAVSRNRFKRIVREAFRLCCRELRTGIDINVKPSHVAYEAQMPDILAELKNLFKI
jgi:ribonuclease P protein component